MFRIEKHDRYQRKEVDIFNEYKINEKEEYATLFYTNRKGENFKILVDLDDFYKLKELNSSWYIVKKKSNRVYAQTSLYLGKFNGKHKYNVIQLQKYLLDVDKGFHIDHINHNPLDCRRNNLRVATIGENIRNRKSKNSNNTSGYRNVSWSDNGWVVQLQVNGKNTRLGKFDDVDEAGKFAKKMRKKYYGEFAGKS